MSLDTANARDYGAQPPRRGLLARLRGKSAADAFGGGSADDPFAFADDDARFRRRRRILGLILVLVLAGVGGGVAAYLHFAPPPTEEAEAPREGGNRIVQPMPPVPGPENLGRALIAPPGSADNPDHARRAADLAPQPAAPPQPPAPPPEPAKPVVVPTVAAPTAPTPRADRDAASKPYRYADLARPQQPAAPLQPAQPLADLQRRTPGGLTVPTVGSDGRRPWQAYARPFSAPAKTPRIAVVISGLGLAQEATAAAIEAMPPEVSLAFDVGAAQLPERIVAARRAGHEALVELGLQSEAFPAADPGPDGLLTAFSPSENGTRLEQVLARAPLAFGVLARGGDAYATSAPHAAALMNDLRRAGLAWVSAVPFGNADAYPARAGVDVTIDAASFREQIAARLRQAEATATARGSAVVAVEATPLALAQLSPWLGGLAGRGFALAPVSAVVKE